MIRRPLARLGDRLRHEQDGLTLTEVLITIAILGVIIAPLTGAFIMFFRVSDETSSRLNESMDIQIAAAYFSQDVQSVGTRDWTAPPYPLVASIERDVLPTAGDHPCGDASLPEAVVRLAYDDPQTATGVPRKNVVSYVVSEEGGGTKLRRVVCEGSPTPTSNIVVIHNLDPAVDPYASCPTTCASGLVTLTIAIRSPGDTGDSFTIVLEGQRRQT